MEIGEILWKFLLVIVIIISLAAVIFTYLNEKFETDDLEISLLYAKFINSEKCLATNNGYKGTIDLNKFEKATLLQCGVKDEISLRLSLSNLDNKEIKPSLRLGTEKVLSLIPVCDSLSNFKCFNKTSFVSYIDNGKIKPAFLKMEAIKSV